MERCKALWVPLVDLRSAVNEVVEHVQLPVGRGKVYGGTRTVVLREKVWVYCHDGGKLQRESMFNDRRRTVTFVKNIR